MLHTRIHAMWYIYTHIHAYVGRFLMLLEVKKKSDRRKSHILLEDGMMYVYTFVYVFIYVV